MKLGDIVLTDLEYWAFRRLLASYVTKEHLAEHEAQEAAEEERNNRWFEALTRIARDTARRDGLTTFWRGEQAAASWKAFIASESYFSPLDIDEHFQSGPDWEESWILAYDNELWKMREEQIDQERRSA